MQRVQAEHPTNLCLRRRGHRDLYDNLYERDVPGRGHLSVAVSDGDHDAEFLELRQSAGRVRADGGLLSIGKRQRGDPIATLFGTYGLRVGRLRAGTGHPILRWRPGQQQNLHTRNARTKDLELYDRRWVRSLQRPRYVLQLRLLDAADTGRAGTDEDNSADLSLSGEQLAAMRRRPELPERGRR